MLPIFKLVKHLPSPPLDSGNCSNITPKYLGLHRNILAIQTTLLLEINWQHLRITNRPVYVDAKTQACPILAPVD